MKFRLCTFLVAGLFLAACSNVPPEEPIASNNLNSGGQAAESQADNGPAATAEIVLGGQSSQAEGYPEPEQLAAGDYPEPESAMVAADYPAPEVAADEADIADNSLAALSAADIPDIAGEGDVEVLYVAASLSGDGSWNFSVTLEHPDTGDDDYANGWDVVLPDGTVIIPNPEAGEPFTRLLTHPHVNEQPFTRSQSGIQIPAGINTVYVRGHELLEGYGSTVVSVDLTVASGDRFEVSR